MAMPASVDDDSELATDLAVEIIESESDFLALEYRWNALAQRTVQPSVFLTHEWFRAAWAWRRLDADLRILVVRDGDVIVGILPLVSPRCPAGQAQRLELLTVPDTQCCDLVVEAARLEAVANALSDTLAALPEWDLLQLEYLDPEGAITRALVPALQRAGLLTEEHHDRRNAYIPLDGDWNRYYANRSRRLKKGNNLIQNRMRRAGDVRIQHVTTSTDQAQPVDDIVDAVVEISRRSWKQATGNSLDHPGPGAFIRELSRSAAAKGWLSIWLVHLGGKAVAMEYQLNDGGNVHALRADFDSRSGYPSPGSFLLRQMIERLFGQGYRRYYMGPGNNSYKARWTDMSIPLWGIHVYNRTVAGRAMGLWKGRVKPWLREALGR